MANQGQSVPDSFKLEQFGGMLPAWDVTIIPPKQAAFAENTYLFTGALAGWRKPKLLYTLLSGTSKFAYRLPRLAEAYASATLFILATPVEGVTVTVGEETYTFRTTATAAYDVAIGGSATGAAVNLFSAITGDRETYTGVGTRYGVGTIANPDVYATRFTDAAYDPPRVTCYAPTSGAAFNSTPVSSNNEPYCVWRYSGVHTTTFQGGQNVSFDASITGSSVWMEFDDPDTDVLRSPVVNDQYDRYYIASPTLAPKYNTRERIEAGLPAWFLGVPAPGCAPGVTVAGGGDDITLGFLTSGGGAVSQVTESIWLVPFTPTGAVELNDIVAVLGADAPTTGDFAVATGLLYDDLNGAPNDLLNIGSNVDLMGMGSGEEVTSAFTNPTGLLADVQYWMGFAYVAADGEAVVWTGADAVAYPTSVSANKLATFASGPPSTFGAYNANAANPYFRGNGTSASVLSARAYVYTYETEYGEESAPSPATIESGWSNGTWTIDLFQPSASQIGVTRNIKTLKLYRSITALSGNTTYYFITELPIGTAQYVDVLSDDELVSNDQLATLDWGPPPEDLLGMVAMPNGMMAGWRKNEIWFCEPYRPHSWPVSYVLTTEYPIVGLGVTSNSVIACTSGAPYVATGTAPNAMTATKIATSEPCHSRGSILGTNDGVFYTSPNGLILVTQYGAVTNTTELWITREKWQSLTPQKNLRSVFLSGCYFSMGTVRSADTSVAQRGFTCEISANNQQNSLMQPQPGGHRIGFNTLTGPNAVDVDNVRIDPWSSVCLVFQNGGVWYYDFADQASVMQTYTWRSKKFQQRARKNFQALRIWFSIPDGTPALNATRFEEPKEDATWQSLPADRYGFIRIYAGNNELVTCREIRRPQELLRIESGFKHETWWFEVEARVPVSNFQVGTSAKAMAKT